ncbi:isoleucine--tRNA ligase, partial [Candidatus Micrarchaeota archaeon CG11_big_fil_rev_8_21_14_0_20_47_5]
MVLSDEFVSVEDGSGLVHCAPGHGPQDFIIGKRFDIEIFSPIDAEGKFTQEAGEYEGMDTQSAGKRILEYLDEVNALVHSGKIVHRYPHCWRCKTKLIYLTTDQWFITVSRLKERMMEEIEKCNFTPSFAKTRFSDFVRAAPDWCISRQRYWGIPLPIWICEKCAHMKVVGSASELPIKLEDLHRPQIDTVEFECEKCKGKMKRIPDILDVWFDSGNAVWAQFEAGEALFPANVIIEGKDQTRGWFYSLLGSGLVLKDCIPYSNLVMHGFFVDEKGEKMSKSVGNFVPLEEIMKKNGSDAFRLWCLSSTIWDDLRFNWDEIREASVALGILYNLGAYLQRFYPDNK